MRRKHVVITGTGRAGTSFLIELLTHLGLETGYTVGSIARHKSTLARAGLEKDIRKDGAPYVVKSPWFSDYVDEVLGRDDIEIEHVFVPMRNLHAAAESRRFVTAQALSQMNILARMRHQLRAKPIAGGRWQTRDESQQEEVLLLKVYNLILSLSKTMIPITLLQYPRLVSDAKYLFEKLNPILGDVRFSEFESVFQRVADQGLVHQFNANDC